MFNLFINRINNIEFIISSDFKQNLIQYKSIFSGYFLGSGCYLNVI